MYYAKIFNEDRHGFLILRERLSFYVNAAASKAGAAILNTGAAPKNSRVIILNGDTPLITKKTLKSAAACDKTGCVSEQNGLFYIIPAEVYNELIMGFNNEPDFAKFSAALKKINGMKIFDKNIFSVPKAEAVIADNPVTLDKAARVIRRRINKKHMEKGVIFIDSQSAFLGPRVRIAEGCIISQGAVIEGNTSIGKKTVIGPYTKLYDMQIGENCEITHSVASSSKIGDETTIGPFAYIRPSCNIGSHCRIGDFVEVKNAVLGDHTKASHLTYIGDADIGEYVNMGCGTITANYDGKKKARTVIEDGAFIGSNSNLIAPVTVKKGAFIAAGSTITDEVPDGALAIARARQVNKPEWERKD